MSAKAKTRVRARNLEDELDSLRAEHRHYCSHESEIADDIFGDVERLLDRFGLLNAVEPIPQALHMERYFCGSSDLALTHKHYCIYHAGRDS